MWEYTEDTIINSLWCFNTLFKVILDYMDCWYFLYLSSACLRGNILTWVSGGFSHQAYLLSSAQGFVRLLCDWKAWLRFLYNKEREWQGKKKKSILFNSLVAKIDGIYAFRVIARYVFSFNFFCLTCQMTLNFTFWWKTWSVYATTINLPCEKRYSII